MNIVEFLRARLDEDEAVARAAISDGYGAQDWAGMDGPTDAHIARHDPARVLREVEVKRRIVDLAWHHLGEDVYAWGMEEAKRQVLVLMASVYADHPDYARAWEV